MAFTFTWTDKVDNVDFNKAKDVNDLAHGIQETQSAFNALSVPTKVSELQNDSGYITAAAIPTKVSQLENDSGYITNSVNHFSVGTRFTISSDDSNRRTDITAYSEAGDSLYLTAYNLNVNASVVRIGPTQTYIQNVVDPTDSGDAANKAYVDSAIASAITATLSTAV